MIFTSLFILFLPTLSWASWSACEVTDHILRFPELHLIQEGPRKYFQEGIDRELVCVVKNSFWMFYVEKNNHKNFIEAWDWPWWQMQMQVVQRVVDNLVPPGQLKNDFFPQKVIFFPLETEISKVAGLIYQKENKGHILLEQNLDPDKLAPLLTHEFYHVLQNEFSSENMPYFLYEGSALMAEDLVSGGVHVSVDWHQLLETPLPVEPFTTTKLGQEKVLSDLVSYYFIKWKQAGPTIKFLRQVLQANNWQLFIQDHFSPNLRSHYIQFAIQLAALTSDDWSGPPNSISPLSKTLCPSANLSSKLYPVSLGKKLLQICSESEAYLLYKDEVLPHIWTRTRPQDYDLNVISDEQAHILFVK